MGWPKVIAAAATAILRIHLVLAAVTVSVPAADIASAAVRHAVRVREDPVAAARVAPKHSAPAAGKAIRPAPRRQATAKVTLPEKATLRVPAQAFHPAQERKRVHPARPLNPRLYQAHPDLISIRPPPARAKRRPADLNSRGSKTRKNRPSFRPRV